jgi:hypothetical protein
MNRQNSRVGWCAALAVWLFASAGQAVVIYSDDFSGDSTSTLVGTTPDNGAVGEVWQGIETGAQWTTDGAITNTADQSRIAYLDFVPATGNVYTLTVDVSHLNQARAFYFGFMSSVPTEGQSFFNGIASPWMRIQGNGETWAMITGSGGSGQTVAASGYIAQNNTLKIVLDTSGDLWEVEWFLNGSSIQTYTYTANPSILGVGMGRLREGTYDVDNFELSGVSASTSPVLYYDDFSGGNSTSLIGTTPDTTQVGETWQGISTGSQWTADGAITNDVDQSRIAYLEFIPETGKVYTVSVDETHINKLYTCYFGFMSSVPTEGQSFFSGIASPWMRIQGNGDTWAMITGGGGSGQTVAASGYTAQMNTMQVVLDTTESAWTVEWFLNGTSFQTYTYSSNPDIQYVGFGRYRSGTYDVDRFELSAASEIVQETPTATIVSMTPTNALMKLIVSSNSSTSFWPKATTELTSSTVWTNIPHSLDGQPPFAVTNLNYSGSEGSNYVIYVDAAESQKYYKLGSE